jgi:hypothetical protein
VQNEINEYEHRQILYPSKFENFKHIGNVVDVLVHWNLDNYLYVYKVLSSILDVRLIVIDSCFVSFCEVSIHEGVQTLIPQIGKEVVIIESPNISSGVFNWV